MKDKKIKIVLLIFLVLIIFIILVNIKNKYQSPIAKFLVKNNEISDKLYTKIYGNNNNIVFSSENETLVYDFDSKKIFTEKGEIILLKNGYYLLKQEDNYDLKRKGKVVASKIDINDKTKLYHDDKALYVTINENDHEVSNTNFAYTNNMGENIFYNKKTGEILNKWSNENLITLILNSEESNQLAVLKNETGSYQLFDLNNNKLMFDNYQLIFDNYNLEQNKVFLNNSKYFIVKDENQKVGVINHKGKVVIPCKYDSIKFTNNNYFIVSQNHKYGLITEQGENYLDIVYDNIKVVNNYIIVTKGNQLNVLDEKLKNILPDKVEVYNTKDLQNINNFTVNQTKNGDIQINTEHHEIFKDNEKIFNGTNILIKDKEVFINSEYYILTSLDETLTNHFYTVDTSKTQIDFFNQDLVKTSTIKIDSPLEYIYGVSSRIVNLNETYFDIKTTKKVDYPNLIVESYTDDNNYRYLIKDDILKIYRDETKLIEVKGREIKHIVGSYFVVTNDDYNQYLVEISKK